jgi:hypothetical protein
MDNANIVIPLYVQKVNEIWEPFLTRFMKHALDG